MALTLAALSTGALASQNTPAASADASKQKPRMMCTKEKPMGSNRPVRICRDADAVDKHGEAHRDELREIQKIRTEPPVT